MGGVAAAIPCGVRCRFRPCAECTCNQAERITHSDDSDDNSSINSFYPEGKVKNKITFFFLIFGLNF